MNLRKSTLILTGGTLIALIMVVLVISSTILLRGFADLDRHQAGKNADRLCQELASELEAVYRTGQDWARWDDTWNFLQGENPSYPDDNLDAESIIQIHLGLMAFVDTSGNALLIKMLAPDAPASCEPPESLRRLLETPGMWTRPADPLETVSGILLTEQGPPLLAVSLPVLHSNGDGPPAGRMILGRWIDRALLADISIRTKTKPRILPPPDGGTVFAGEPYLQESSPEAKDAPVPRAFCEVRVRSAGPDSVEGVALVRDFAGQPAFMVVAAESRAIYAEGWKAVRLLTILVLVAGVGFSVLILIPLERRLLARMGRLHDEVGVVADNWQPGMSVNVEGNDEIAGMAVTINRLLAALAESYRGQELMVEDLRRSKEAAESATRSKSAFLANTSHEIRTPMNGVLGMIGVLLKSPLTDEQREWALTIQSSAEALLGILNDILDLSKIEQGKLVLEHTPLDLLDIVEDAVSLMAWRAHEKTLDLYVSVAPGTRTMVYGDPLRIRQIVMNLLGNAIKFTSKGEVSVALSQPDAGDGYRLEVRDTGIGIPPAQQAAIFEKYTQAEASTARRFGGSGLGLSITRELVRLMQGSVGVQSEPGQGSCFWVELPYEAAGEQEPVDPALQDARVLVVEGHSGTRTSLARQLESWGCRCTVASTDEEAAARSHEARYDLILLESGLAAREQGALLRRIRETDGNAATPVALLSPTCGSNAEQAVPSSHLADIVLKPVRRTRLRNLLLKVLGRAPVMAAPALVPLEGPASPGARGPSSPAATRTEPDVSRTETAASGPRLVSRVLLAEDHPINRTVAVTLLRHMNVEADVAANGAEAVEMSGRFPYPLILMDVQMPVMDGLEATRLIREREGSTGKHVVIVAMTANASETDRRACLDAGMDDHLAKPVSQSSLRKALETWSARVNAGSEGDGEDEGLLGKAA